MKECRCGCKKFEEVDVTPIGIQKRRYFTRCKKCGLVIMAYRCKFTKSVFTIGLVLLKRLCS